MRLLHTIAGLYEISGGPSRTTLALCEELATLGATVEIVTQRSRRVEGDYRVPSSERVATRFVDCLYLARPRFAYSPRLRSVVRQVCVDHQIDILHDHGIWLPNNHAAIGVARERNIPLVVSPRGMLEPWSLAFRAWKKRIAWTLYEKRDLASARVFCATSSDEATSIRKCGCRQPIAVVPNGVGVPDLSGSRVTKSVPRTALFLSRIHPKKGLPLLVQAWKRVQPRDWRVVVAGPDEGGHRKTVEDAVCDAGLGNTFEFVGPVKDEAKAALFRQADVFILPTMSENFGMVIAEALAHAVPVIATTGVPWGGLVDHSCGWWVQPEAGEIASAIREATGLSDSDRETMGMRGRLWVEREFSWPSAAKRMLSVYEWILNGGEAPDCVIKGSAVSYSIGKRGNSPHANAPHGC
jgi:glycosyltransferase involved in cell wall biosynthesis